MKRLRKAMIRFEVVFRKTWDISEPNTLKALHKAIKEKNRVFQQYPDTWKEMIYQVEKEISTWHINEVVEKPTSRREEQKLKQYLQQFCR